MKQLRDLGLWWLVAVLAVGGVFIITFGSALRVGGIILAAAFLVAAMIRLCTPVRQRGDDQSAQHPNGLQVRSRFLDVAMLLFFGLTLGIAVILVKLPK